MTSNATKTLRALLVGLSFITFTAAAQAQSTNVWIGPAVGDWSDPANWSLGVVPIDDAVYIDSNTGQDSSVLYEDISSIGSLAIDAGDALTIAEGASLAVGPVLNSGSIHIVGQGQGLRAVGTLINAPGGLLSLDNGIYSSFFPYRNPLFWNQAATEGYGNIGNLTIQNDHLIDANITGEQLTLQGKSLTSPANVIRFLSNPGTMRASNAGILRLADWQTVGILNQDNSQAGTIEAWGDSTVLIENTTITGGRITTSTEGGVEEGRVLLSGQLSLEGVELDARTVFFGNSSTGNPQLRNSTFANKKTLYLGRDLQIVGTNTLSGGGVFVLDGDATVRGLSGNSNQPTPKFVNVDNIVVVQQNSSVTFGEEMLVENHGTFEANGPNAFLSLSFNGPDNAQGQWTNSGIIRAVNSGHIGFGYSDSEPFNNTGGILEVDGTSTMNLNDAHIRGGILRGPASEPSSESFRGEPALENVRLEGFIRKQHQTVLIGNIENTGVLKSSGDIQLNSEITFTGGGELSLQSVRSSNNSNNSPLKFINVDNTLRMTDFSTYFDEITLVNRGTVEANGPNSNSQLSVSYHSHPSPRLINSGVIRAIDGGSLDIDYDFQIQNYEIDALGNVTPGKIQAGAGSEISLTAVSGGIVQAAVGGVIRVEDLGYLGSQNTPTDIHLLGRIEAENIGLGGTIRNDGQLVVSGEISSQDVTLLGNGKLQLNGTLLTRNSTFLNGPDHTIIGGGEIRSEGSFFTNEGRIEAKDNNTLTLTYTGPSLLFQQRGELISSGNGTLNVEFEGQFTNYGTVRVVTGSMTTFDGNSAAGGDQFINANGAITDIDGSLWVIDSKLVNEEGGVVQGDGKVFLRSTSLDNRWFINHGTLAPGSSVGQLTIGGDFQQSTTGDLEIDLGGRLPEEFDSLSAWSADLAGLLEVSLVDLGDGTFAPELGDSFEIISLLSNGSVTGEFDTFLLPTLAADLLWGIQYHPTSVVLEVLAPLQADLDADNDVDGSDFLALQRTDPSLFSQWQTEYGSRVIISSPAASQAVPEPTTLALLFPLLVLASLRHNRLQKTAAHERRRRLPTSSTRA